MEKSTKKVTLNVDINLLTYTSKDGSIHTLTEEEYVSAINRVVTNLENTFKENATLAITKKDKIYDFVNFPIHSPITELKYDESNKDTYQHYVYHFLKNYYVDSYKSNHYHNGGNWQHFAFDVNSGLLERMLNKDNENDTVKELIIRHLISGDGVRMYGKPQNNKRVRDLNTTEELKEFFKFILDSEMFKVNDKYECPLRFGNDYGRKMFSTVGELLVLECWRNGHNLEVVKWLVDTYKMELKHIGIVTRYIVDSRVHDADNTGKLNRNDEKYWHHRSYNDSIEFINYLRSKFSEKFELGEFKYKKIVDFIDDLLGTLKHDNYPDEKLNIRDKAEKRGVEEYLANFK